MNTNNILDSSSEFNIYNLSINKTSDVIIEKIESVIEEVEPDTCPICLDEIGETSYVVLECNHKIGLNCYNRMFTHNMYRCPLCRRDFDVEFINISPEPTRPRIVVDNRYEPNLIQQRILWVIGNHNQTPERINRRITRHGQRTGWGERPYLIQIIRCNLNILSIKGYLSRNDGIYRIRELGRNYNRNISSIRTR